MPLSPIASFIALIWQSPPAVASTRSPSVLIPAAAAAGSAAAAAAAGTGAEVAGVEAAGAATRRSLPARWSSPAPRRRGW